jgi:hypothetical protein
MDEPSQRAQWTALTLPIGWCATALRIDWPKYSKGKYDGAQRDAEHAGRGIWEGTYVEPWLFRACIRQHGRPGDCSDDANSHP